MISKPQDVNPFEFIVVSVLRTKQLLRGCTPRVAGSHKPTVTAQMEVSAGMVTGTFGDPDGAQGRAKLASLDALEHAGPSLSAGPRP